MRTADLLTHAGWLRVGVDFDLRPVWRDPMTGKHFLEHEAARILRVREARETLAKDRGEAA